MKTITDLKHKSYRVTAEYRKELFSYIIQQGVFRPYYPEVNLNYTGYESLYQIGNAKEASLIMEAAISTCIYNNYPQIKIYISLVYHEKPMGSFNNTFRLANKFLFGAYTNTARIKD